MKNKKILKTLGVSGILLLTGATLFSCGGSKEASINGVYSLQEYERQVSDWGTDWIVTNDYNLTTYDNNVYELRVSKTACGTADQATRGEQLTVYYGKYSSTANEATEGALDLSLDKADRVIYYQHAQLGVYFGGTYYLDSAATNWSEEIAESSGFATAKDFYDAKAAAFTVSVNPSDGSMLATPVKA